MFLSKHNFSFFECFFNILNPVRVFYMNNNIFEITKNQNLCIFHQNVLFLNSLSYSKCFLVWTEHGEIRSFYAVLVFQEINVLVISRRPLAYFGLIQDFEKNIASSKSVISLSSFLNAPFYQIIFEMLFRSFLSLLISLLIFMHILTKF